MEDLPYNADDPRADRLRARELARPTDDVRRVLLRYADGTQDLIVVAARDRYDAAALRELAAGAGVAAVPVVPAPANLSIVDWGLADGGAPGTHVVALDDLGEESDWQAALATTLDRYPPDSGIRLIFDGAEFPGEYLPAPVFPLAFHVFRDVRGAILRCDYLRTHFSPAIAEQLTRHLVRARRTGAPIDDAEVLALGRSHAPEPRPDTIHAAVRVVATAQPHAVAITDGDDTLTYRELDERATALAQGLRANGVVDGDRVGVCLDRSAGLVVALLAVLKAGAAYVPIDPTHPRERLARTAEDAAPRVVLTNRPDFPYPTVLHPDNLAVGSISDSLIGPGDPAYVIYTSGSTGRPKGVVVPHRNVIGLVEATRADFGLGADDVWTWFHSSAFDYSVWEIWGCLLTGGRLVVVPHFVAREPDRFRDLLVAERVTVLSQTPSAFAQLLEVDHTAAAPRLVVFGGEPLDARALVPWFDRHPESACRVVNMFGITETTVHVTTRTVTRRDALSGSRSVGRPLPGWHVRVLDPAGRLAPPGVAGEIVVGGVGVARGYLGREELTAQRFRPDPFGPGTVYHSGDLGRLRPDGELEHLGRIDDQVKIRGFRIEPGEVRAVLLADPDVRAAAVVVAGDSPATARLEAYVVPATADTAQVRARAAAVLPEHMVPARVVAVATLPLTSNGKLDTAALLATPAAPEEPVGDDLAGELRAVWSEVLGTPVDLDDDFFELGGNSLLAVRIGAALRARGLPPIRLRDLYRHPTIREVLATLGG
ncbi:non-ribosomal peptide synthetase [Actinokineospora sp. NBRC 105648]|uniref:non-ribosomal peptide synthetase n=1 Tax=Actinokineospora sp. NBRC 105648 TaxID=3032206 RepID=UPI002555B3C5|nr:non-ribosomal peptide synthetase [Actinokineospora sp. NBRC 105648]